jgi:cytochrome P450
MHPDPATSAHLPQGAARRPALADLAAPSVLPDPYPVLAGLREASPFPELEGALVVVGRYEDCSRVLRDPRASSDRSSALLTPPDPGPSQSTRSFLSLDPPDHTRLRRLVSRAFTARVVARLEPRIRSLTDELLTAAADDDGGAEGGGLEVVSRLAYLLPVRIISELLGVPLADHARFAGWSARLAHSLQPPLGLSADEAAAQADATRTARSEFSHYFRDLIGRRRDRPGDDLLSLLISAEDQGQRLSEQELISTCILLLVAGHETTVSLISNAVLALLRHPGQLAQLRADPDLAAGAVEETLRYDAPVQLTSRIARGGMEIGPVSPPDGAVILLLLAAAGRDPAAYPDPDLFDIRRGGGHLAFAAGPHFCLGAPLTRLEAIVALQAFAARVDDPELDTDALVYRPNLNLRGPQRLVVRHSGIRGSQSR